MAGYSGGDTVDVDPRHYLNVFRRYAPLILGTVVLFVVISVVSGLTAPRLWSATTTVTVPPPPTSTSGGLVGGVRVTLSPPAVYLGLTYERLLRSATLLDTVIDRLHLHTSPEALARRIRVNQIRDTLLIEVTIIGRDKRETEAIAGAFADALVDYDHQYVASQLVQSRQFAATQLAAAQQDLQTKEAALKQFGETVNLDVIESALHQQVNDLARLKQNSERNRIDLGVARQGLVDVERKLASTGTPDSVREQLSSQHAMLAVKIAELEMQRQMLAAAVSQAEREVASLSARLADGTAQRAQLTRAVKTAEAVYTALAAKATDALVAEETEGIQRGFVRVVDRGAARPLPRGTVSRAVSGVALGVVFGIVAAFGLEYLRPGPGSITAASER